MIVRKDTGCVLPGTSDRQVTHNRCVDVEQVVTGHPGLARHASGDEHDRGTLQRFSQLIRSRVPGDLQIVHPHGFHLDTRANVRQVHGHAHVGNVIECEVIQQRPATRASFGKSLEEQGERLTDPACSTEHCDLFLEREKDDRSLQKWMSLMKGGESVGRVDQQAWTLQKLQIGPGSYVVVGRLFDWRVFLKDNNTLRAHFVRGIMCITTMFILLLLATLIVIQAAQPHEFSVHLRSGFKRVPKNFQVSPSTAKSLLQRSRGLTIVNLFGKAVETVIGAGSTGVASSLSYRGKLVAVGDRGGSGATAFATETGGTVARAALFRLEQIDAIHSALTVITDGESASEAVLFAAADHCKNEVLVEVIPTSTHKAVAREDSVALLFHVVDAQKVAISSQWVVLAQNQFNPRPKACTKNLTAINNRLEQTQLVLPDELCGSITHLTFASDSELIIRTANDRVVVFDLTGPFADKVKFDQQIQVKGSLQLGWQPCARTLVTLSLEHNFYLVRFFDATRGLISSRKLAKAGAGGNSEWERVTLAADGSAVAILRAPKDRPRQLTTSIHDLRCW